MEHSIMRFLIRADAGNKIGAGHVMRCLALANTALELGAEAHIVGRLGVKWVKDLLNEGSLRVSEILGEIPLEEDCCELLDQLAQSAGTAQDTWVILDGYHFTPVCQQAVMKAGYRLLVIDDYAHQSSYHCDVLLNQNLSAEHIAYKGNVGLKLLGPKYALLRPEFRQARSQLTVNFVVDSPKTILVTMGGGDFIEGIASIAEAMNTPEMVGRTVLILSGSMDVARIRQLFAYCPANVHILGRVDDMPKLLLAVDLCITAGGSTCWELCCLGVPFMTLVVAKNQQGVVAALEQLHIAQPFSKKQLLSMLQGCAPAGADLVDGNGAMHVIAKCLQLSGSINCTNSVL